MSSTPSLAGTTTTVTWALFEGGSRRCAGFQIRRAPAGTAATDFSGSGAPCVNGLTEKLEGPERAGSGAAQRDRIRYGGSVGGEGNSGRERQRGQ